MARGRVRNLVGYDYNVNTTWDYTKGGSYCDGQVWSTIKAPEKYPYFYDGQVENRGDLGLGQGRWYSIYGSNQISFGPTAFKSVAPWHGSGNSGLVDSSPVTYSTTANFAFADGHTENIRIEKLIPGLVGGRWWDAFGRQL